MSEPKPEVTAAINNQKKAMIAAMGKLQMTKNLLDQAQQQMVEMGGKLAASEFQSTVDKKRIADLEAEVQALKKKPELPPTDPPADTKH